jgi:hypothetical protein
VDRPRLPTVASTQATGYVVVLVWCAALLLASNQRHAWHFVDDPIAEHLEKYADELEALANRLARR